MKDDYTAIIDDLRKMRKVAMLKLLDDVANAIEELSRSAYDSDAIHKEALNSLDYEDYVR